jgi:hypothetical protein
MTEGTKARQSRSTPRQAGPGRTAASRDSILLNGANVVQDRMF